jgi:hypothetical protein
MRRMPRRHALMLAGMLLAKTGCGGHVEDGPPPGFASCPAPDGGAPAAPDYWHDVKPILDGRCGACHTADGIAPFPLLTYLDASSSALLIQAAVSSRKMPPWPPNGCCRAYRHDRSLSQSEIDTIVSWIDAGTPEGDPQGAPPSTPAGTPMLSRVDVSLRMSEPYLPAAQEGTGDVRCFLLEDWPFDADRYVTGVDVRPGNRSIVQNVVVQTVGESDLAALRARAGLDGRPGFDCRDLGAERPLDGALASWTPGQTPFESPDGVVGIPIAAHAPLVLRVLYDLRNGVAQPDQTQLDFQVADTVQHPARGMVVTDTYDPSPLTTNGRSLYLLTVNLLQDPRGSRGRVAIHRKGGPWDCLLDVPSWDYRWASTYELAEPVRVDAGDRLYVDCRRDAPAAGINEVCAGILLYTDALP